MNQFNQNTFNNSLNNTAENTPQSHQSDASTTSAPNTIPEEKEALTPTQRKMQKLMEQMEKLKEQEAAERQKAAEKQEKEVLKLLKKSGIFKYNTKQIEKALPQMLQLLESRR